MYLPGPRASKLMCLLQPREGVWLSPGGGALGNGVSALSKETGENSFTPSPCESTARRSRRKPDPSRYLAQLHGIHLGFFRAQNCEQRISVVDKSPRSLKRLIATQRQLHKAPGLKEPRIQGWDQKTAMIQYSDSRAKTTAWWSILSFRVPKAALLWTEGLRHIWVHCWPQLTSLMSWLSQRRLLVTCDRSKDLKCLHSVLLTWFYNHFIKEGVIITSDYLLYEASELWLISTNNCKQHEQECLGSN